MKTSDFPQADRFYGIEGVVDAVYSGKLTDIELELHIGLDSDGRQGRYYRKAAVELGLIDVIDSIPYLTFAGNLLMTTVGQARIELVRSILMKNKVIGLVLDFIHTGPKYLGEIRNFVISIYPGEASTARRRTSTIKSYLEDTGLIVEFEGIFRTSSLYSTLLSRPIVESELEQGEDAPLPPGDTSFRKQRVVGYCPDAALRKAIELRAVAVATEYYVDRGFSVEDVGATHSFDLLVENSEEQRHIEVKGSSRVIESVILTKNEVAHARDYAATDLVTVQEIEVCKNGDGIWNASGGDIRVTSDWTPAEDQLSPLSYLYILE